MNTRYSIIVFLFIISSVTYAHHSDVGLDDKSVVVIEGKVTEFRWRQPHVYAEIETTERGESVRWDVQLVAVNVLARRGWNSKTLQLDDEVIVRLHPATNGKKYGKLVSILRADGSAVATSPSNEFKMIKADSLAGKWTGQRPVDAPPSPPPAPVDPEVPPCTTGFDCFFKTRLVLTEDGKSAMQSYDALSSENPESTCVGRPTPAAIVSARGYLLEFDLSDADEKIVIHSEYFNEQRDIWMDGREHPQSSQTFQTGHSIGRWEGDTLVVDTRNFDDHRSPYQIGVPSGSQKHVLERYRLNDEKTAIEMEFILSDPEYISEPLQHSGTFFHAPHMQMLVSDCDPENTSRFAD